MGTILIGLSLLAVLLFFLSFFLHDPYKQLREEIDQLAIQQLQEMYQIKKKLKVLEEELLVSDLEPSLTLSKKQGSIFEKEDVHDIIKNQVWSLAKQGTPIKQIAEQSSLPVHKVDEIIAEFSIRDAHDE